MMERHNAAIDCYMETGDKRKAFEIYMDGDINDCELTFEVWSDFLDHARKNYLSNQIARKAAA